MTSLSLTPLFRQSIGFDRFSDLFDTVLRTGEESVNNYPPYNIEKLGENDYRITMAVAGFSRQDLDIISQANLLVVRGKMVEQDKEVDYLYKGIANRAFERKFSLADHVKVTGASLEQGLLKIDLVREIPEAQKPRTIEIKAKDGANGKVDTDKVH